MIVGKRMRITIFSLAEGWQEEKPKGILALLLAAVQGRQNKAFLTKFDRKGGMEHRIKILIFYLADEGQEEEPLQV